MPADSLRYTLPTKRYLGSIIGIPLTATEFRGASGCALFWKGNFCSLTPSLQLYTDIYSGVAGELGLESVGIVELQDSVPLPLFRSEPGSYIIKTDGDVFVEYHFLAQVTLQRLIERVRSSILVSGMYRN